MPLQGPAHLFASIDQHHLICPDASPVLEEYGVASFDELYAVYRKGLEEHAELQRRADEKNDQLDMMFKHVSAYMSAQYLSSEIDAYIAKAPLAEDVPCLAPRLAAPADNFFPSYVGYGKCSDALAQALLDLRRAYPGGWSSDPAQSRAPLESFFRTRGVWAELVSGPHPERLLGFAASAGAV